MLGFGAAAKDRDAFIPVSRLLESRVGAGVAGVLAWLGWLAS